MPARVWQGPLYVRSFAAGLLSHRPLRARQPEHQATTDAKFKLSPPVD